MLHEALRQTALAEGGATTAAALRGVRGTVSTARKGAALLLQAVREAALASRTPPRGPESMLTREDRDELRQLVNQERRARLRLAPADVPPGLVERVRKALTDTPTGPSTVARRTGIPRGRARLALDVLAQRGEVDVSRSRGGRDLYSRS